MQYPVRARLTARDLVSIGIYSVLIRLITMIVSIPFTPFLAVTMPFISGVCAFFSAPVYLLMAYKVGKRGVMMLLCAVMGLSYVLMGYGFMLPYLFVAGAICEAVMWPVGAYRRFWRSVVGFSAYSLFYMAGGYLPIYFWGQDYFAQSGFTQDVADIYNYFALTAGWVAVAATFTVAMAILGCLFGRRLLRRHFVKSGLISEAAK